MRAVFKRAKLMRWQISFAPGAGYFGKSMRPGRIRNFARLAEPVNSKESANAYRGTATSIMTRLRRYTTTALGFIPVCDLAETPTALTKNISQRGDKLNKTYK